jgi:hypothetical protein
MSDEQQQPKPEITPQTTPAAKPARRWPSAEVWLLGVLGVFGILGFALVFSLVMARTTPNPQAAAAAAQAPGGVQLVTTPSGALQGPPGERGPQGPAGPAGPRGANGDAGIRIVRLTCNSGDCSLQCEPDEVLLTAHCGAGRTAAVYPTETTALCRSPRTSNARVEVVAACVKSVRR